MSGKASANAGEPDSELHISGTGSIPIPENGILLLPVRNTVLFPGMTIPLTVGRVKSASAVELANQWSRQIGVVMQHDPNTSDPDLDELYKIGTSARILRHILSPDGTHHLIVQGQARIRLYNEIGGLPCLAAIFETLPQEAIRSKEIDASFLQLKSLALEALALLPETPEELAQTVASISEPETLSDLIAQHLDIEPEEKQEILETTDLEARINRMIELLAYRIGVLELSKDISKRTQKSLSAQQRQHILRQQLAAIRRELGDSDGSAEELADLKTKIESRIVSEEAKRQALAEHARLERIPESSTEYAMLRSYLDILIDLPWAEPPRREIDLEAARQILDAEHYGLDKIKKRILEFLAVSKLKNNGKGPILCFVGPPGVGKTSLGQSIARAMNRRFARLSLGGLHDESEIRGHRMTYVGAMPGNIIKTIQRAGARDCVFMLDEIDKLGASRQGDPASALLEVLDPAQNSSFRDNYLNLSFDLSRIVFIATANILDSIPGPLRDRMEVISLSGYTVEEKREIAKRYLIHRQLDENGIQADQCAIAPGVIDFIIERYTREAGVRSLEREIGAIIRACAIRVVSSGCEPTVIDIEAAEAALGPPRYETQSAMRLGTPGVATALAWTPVGGDILFIEASHFPGSGKLILTGQLGEVMRESAQAALTLVKTNASRLNLDPEIFPASDIHIHVPAGAIPKDGPSAGTAMFLALLSALKNVSLRPDTAITGEISLRGNILPVGGIKEKIIAADRGGIRHVLIPNRNQSGLADIPKFVLDRLKVTLVSTVTEAVDAAF